MADTEFSSHELGSSHVVKLDVGGTKFTTTVATLRNVPNTMLSAMFSGRHSIRTNAEGYYFIDRDGTHFRHILNMLRSPEDYKLALSKSDMMELEHEARYYCLLDAFENAKQLAVLPVWRVTATSAGFNVHRTDPPNYRAYFTSRKDAIADGGRGWNILLFDPQTQEIIGHRNFDFYGGRENAVRECYEFLSNVQADTVVAIAVKDDGASHITDALLQLLKQFGGSSRVARDFQFRASFAMIGRKGMQPGQAVEAYNANGDVVTVAMNIE
jgi:hypothetical protein